MSHDHMDHGGHSGHDGMHHGGDMDMPMCSMNMLFTWSTENLCIVFPQWRVTGTISLLLSLLGVVLLTAGYELVRDASRRYEASESAAGGALRVGGAEARGNNRSGRADQKSKMIRASLYAVQVFYSFFIMLLFMTYNGWVMLAVAGGAFVGYMAFGDNAPATKTVACH